MKEQKEFTRRFGEKALETLKNSRYLLNISYFKNNGVNTRSLTNYLEKLNKFYDFAIQEQIL